MIDPARRLARNLDPHTSKEAAQEITASGEHDRQLSIVLDAVRRYPGLTSSELSQTDVGLDRYQIARRLSELKGMVEKGPARVCRVTGRCALTWNPVQLADTPQGRCSNQATRQNEQHDQDGGTDASSDRSMPRDGLQTPPGWLFSPSGDASRL